MNPMPTSNAVCTTLEPVQQVGTKSPQASRPEPGIVSPSFRTPASQQLPTLPRPHAPEPHYSLVNKVYKSNVGIHSKGKILLLCEGLAERDTSLHNLLLAADFENGDYDIVNGPARDLADNAVFDPIIPAVLAGEYVGALASPDCSTFSKVRNMPGGPPPLRGVDGKQLKVYPAGPCKGQPLSLADVELIRTHTLVAIRVAKVLAGLHVRGLPSIYETPEETL